MRADPDKGDMMLLTRFVDFIRFPLTGGWSLWITDYIHIYHAPAARRPYGITWVR